MARPATPWLVLLAQRDIEAASIALAIESGSLSKVA